MQPAILDGRAITRILHAISSPLFPASQWNSSRWWGRYSHVDFDCVLRVAEEVAGSGDQA